MEQLKGTQVCHLSVEKHIGQQQPAASFSHLSIGFGGLRWYIKPPKKYRTAPHGGVIFALKMVKNTNIYSVL
jgi:hypothetical protein